ncbi:hypothetical protein ACWCYY_05270 [Kitasatospora sp. NPDC001664]|uniref:hypothetical protein n=1 Tax=Kitasatospora albolonga TaxID=68173 RepID=UPI0035EFC668
MPTALLHRGLRAAAVAALALTTTLTGATASTAAPETAPVPVEVTIGPDGIQAPDSAPGGLVAFRLTTADPAGRSLQVLRPKDGSSIDELLAGLAQAVSADPAAAAQGITLAQQRGEALGGVHATPAVPGTATTEITPGTVYLVDFTSFLSDPQHPVLRSLELCDGPSATLAHYPDGIVITHETPGGPRFLTEGVTRADGHYLVRNASDEIHEMALQRVPDGTTDEQLQAVYDAILSGNPPAPGPQQPIIGLGAISPGRSALYHAEGLPPGTYVLLCFVPDHENGLPHAFLGMHQVVVLS